MSNSPWITQNAAMDASAACGFVNSSPGFFDMTCNGAVKSRFITHTYIMGFQFNPSGAFTLAASALLGNGGSTTTDADEALKDTSFVYNPTPAAGTTATALPLTGPKILVKGFGSQLQYIKIAVVITTILDLDTYPTGSTAEFQYSGIYLDYTLFNANNYLIQAADRATNGLNNYNYFSLLRAQYSIYGLSSFQINTLPSSVTVVNYDISFPDINTVSVKSDDVNYITNVKVSGDRWNSLINTCSATSTVMFNIQRKSLVTVPSIQATQQNIYEASSALDFFYTAAPIGDLTQPLSSSVTFTNTLFFEKFTAGMAYKLSWTITNWNVDTPPKVGYSTAVQVQYVISIQGNQIVNKILNVDAQADSNNKVFPVIDIGYIFNTATPVVSITINTPRDAVNSLKLQTLLVITQYSNAYDPVSDCCVKFCPANNGVNILSTPPTCVACTLGLFYNSVSGSCECQPGFYVVEQTSGQSVGSKQCYPCFAPLCQSCTKETPTVCTSCVQGAAVNNASVCACLSGYFQNGNACNTCPNACATCSVATICNTCADNTTRDKAQNCACIQGFYDAGTAICSKCSALCKTCNASSTCTSCFSENNRTLVNGQCVCSTGFYQIVNTDGSLTCGACAPTCTQCSLLPTLCSTCNPNDNRILGIDALGNQVCNCLPGFSENNNGACVQSSCSADPYCSNCQTVLTNSICIRCVAATNRFLALPSQKCLCQQGFF